MYEDEGLSGYANSQLNKYLPAGIDLLRIRMRNAQADIGDAVKAMHKANGVGNDAPSVEQAHANPQSAKFIQDSALAIRQGMNDVNKVLEDMGGGNKRSGLNTKEAVEVTNFYVCCSESYEQISEHMDSGNMNDLYDRFEALGLKNIIDNVRLKDLSNYADKLKNINSDNWSDDMKVDALSSCSTDNQGEPLVKVLSPVHDNDPKGIDHE